MEFNANYFVTKQSIIRPLSKNDYTDFRTLLLDQEVIRFFNLPIQSIDTNHTKRLFEYLLDNGDSCGKRCRIFAILSKKHKRFCGIWGLYRPGSVDMAECFYAITPDFRARSIASEINARLCHYFHNTMHEKIVAYIPENNVISSKVVEKCGMRCIGGTYRNKTVHSIYTMG